MYTKSEELYYLLEEVKSISESSHVGWSETVSILGDNTLKLINGFLEERIKEIDSRKR